MKKIVIPAVATCIILLSVSCKKTGLNPEDNRQQSNKQNPIELAAPITNAFADFSFSFFKTLQTEQLADDNIFVSPLSLHIALGMLVNGAEATTKAGIMAALQSSHLSQTELNEAYKKILTELPEADPLVKMAIANAIFYKNGFTVETPFLNTMKNTFNAEIKGLPFVQADLITINKWASDNTNGKIPKVLDAIGSDLVMLLMNALYFKGDWRSKFDKKDTKDQPFYFEKNGQKMVKMMNQKDTFKYANAENYTALQMPYGNGQFVATLLLPKEGNTVATVLNDFSTAKWGQLQNGFQTLSVEVGLPKFKLEQDFDLKKTLQKMGMVKAFIAGGAELQGINKTAPLFVDFVKQNTFVAVDEAGTEAAAVTTIGVELTSAPVAPPRFICDRPFGFIISEKTSNTILFIGRIMNPKE